MLKFLATNICEAIGDSESFCSAVSEGQLLATGVAWFHVLLAIISGTAGDRIMVVPTNK